LAQGRKDAKYNALDEGSLQRPISPAPRTPASIALCCALRSGTNRCEIIARVRNSIAEINPNIFVDGVTGLDHQVNQSIATQSLIASPAFSDSSSFSSPVSESTACFPTR
jgi:hypothetical protein